MIGLFILVQLVLYQIPNVEPISWWWIFLFLLLDMSPKAVYDIGRK